MSKLFVIRNLKRNGKGKWWAPHRLGYVDDLDKAGVYSAADLEKCAGKRGDWVAELAPQGAVRDGEGSVL